MSDDEHRLGNGHSDDASESETDQPSAKKAGKAEIKLPPRKQFTASFDIRLLQAVRDHAPLVQPHGKIFATWQRISQLLLKKGFHVEARRCRDRAKALLDAHKRGELRALRQNGSASDILEKENLLKQIVAGLPASILDDDFAGSSSGAAGAITPNVASSLSAQKRTYNDDDDRGMVPAQRQRLEEDLEMIKQRNQMETARWEYEKKEREDRWKFEKTEREHKLRLEEMRLKVEQERIELDRMDRDRRLKIDEQRMELEYKERSALLKLLMEKDASKRV